MDKYNITFLKNVRNQSYYGRVELPFDELIEIFNESDDIRFKKHMKRLGYLGSLKYSREIAYSYVRNRNWDELVSKWSYFAFFHRSVAKDKDLDVLKHIHISNLSKTPIDRKEFIGIEEVPDQVFDAIRSRSKKGTYSLFKELSPSFIFGKFDPKAKSISLENMMEHSGLMAIDIDIPMDDQQAVLNIITKHFPVYAVLFSPSGTMRPIFRIDVSLESILEFNAWDSKGMSETWVNHNLIKMTDYYQKLMNRKIKNTLSQYEVMSSGKYQKLEIDKTVFNSNRPWFITRSKLGRNKISDNHTPLSLTRNDCMNYGENDADRYRVFPCVFGGVA